jgi:hypothetical protein
MSQGRKTIFLDCVAECALSNEGSACAGIAGASISAALSRSGADRNHGKRRDGRPGLRSKHAGIIRNIELPR